MPKVVAIIVVPMIVTPTANHVSFSPTTTKASAKKATDISTQASHISLLMIAIICFFALLSITTIEVWTTTTAKEMNRDMESNIKKIKNDGVGAIFASPRESPSGMSVGSSTYWPGTVKMPAKATVAMRTATTVVELTALLRPSACILLRRLAMHCTRLLVCLVCSSWSWTSCLMSLTVCFNSRAVFVTFGFSALALGIPYSCRMIAMSGFPVFSAVSKAVSPDLFTALASIPSWLSSFLTICTDEQTNQYEVNIECGSDPSLILLQVK